MYFPDEDKLISIVPPLGSAVSSAVPALLVATVAMKDDIGSVEIPELDCITSISPVSKSIIFISPDNTTKVSFPPLPVAVKV